MLQLYAIILSQLYTNVEYYGVFDTMETTKGEIYNELEYDHSFAEPVAVFHGSRLNVDSDNHISTTCILFTVYNSVSSLLHNELYTTSIQLSVKHIIYRNGFARRILFFNMHCWI